MLDLPRPKRALITGIFGQDGHFLAALLTSLGYVVFGMYRQSVNRERDIARLRAFVGEENSKNLRLLEGDMSDHESLIACVRDSEPDEVYNLAAISYAPVSWRLPVKTMDINATGVVRLLQAVRQCAPGARFYQASTSEMFGAVVESPQSESTPFRPVHPYGVAKVAGHWNAVNFREQHGMHVSCGILFNHESELRGDQFVTVKVCKTAVEQKYFGRVEPLRLWTLDTVRDWGYAGDYVRAMHLMVQQDVPGDYVVGTEVGHTVGDLVKGVYDRLGMDWKNHVVVEPPSHFKVDLRCNFIADARKIRAATGWAPETSFSELIEKIMRVYYPFQLGPL